MDDRCGRISAFVVLKLIFGDEQSKEDREHGIGTP